MADDIAGPESVNRLMTEMRPRLHRYCARMLGSAFDGEDVVQEALAKAAEALPTAGTLSSPERWLFTIAHNTALDTLRRRKRQAEVPLEDDYADSPGSGPEPAWAAATASLAALMQLSVIQRSTVVLVDVLEYSLAETVEILEVTLPAVKSALRRGRVHLQSLSEAADSPQPALDAQDLARVRSYAETFNARDFDTLRNLLAADVKLDLVNRLRLTGSTDVGAYFGRYGEKSNWKITPVLAEGRAALLVSNPADPADEAYVVLLEWQAGRIQVIRDFRFARYVMDSLVVAHA